MSECIFCRIAAGELPSYSVYETENALAFLDINPLSPGHTLVIPKKHAKRLTDMSAEDMAEVGRALPAVARAVMAAVGAEGFNVYQTNGACSGQQVGHVHFHIIPRNPNDGLGFRWHPGKYEEGEMEKQRRQIEKYIEKELGD